MPRFPNDPKNERSLRTCADVAPERRASSSEETVGRLWVSDCSRYWRYRERRRTVESEIFRIVNYFTIGGSKSRGAQNPRGPVVPDAPSGRTQAPGALRRRLPAPGLV